MAGSHWWPAPGGSAGHPTSLRRDDFVGRAVLWTMVPRCTIGRFLSVRFS